MFCANTTSITNGFSQIFAYVNPGPSQCQSIRYLTGTHNFDGWDLNTESPTYANGVNVYTPNKVTMSSALPSGYNIYCAYVNPSYQTSMAFIGLLGEYQRGFYGYAGDFFIGTTGFGTNQQIQLEGYLGYKYKCQSSLPTNHPFYSATNSKVVTLS